MSRRTNKTPIIHLNMYYFFQIMISWFNIKLSIHPLFIPCSPLHGCGDFLEPIPAIFWDKYLNIAINTVHTDESLQMITCENTDLRTVCSTQFGQITWVIITLHVLPGWDDNPRQESLEIHYYFSNQLFQLIDY